MIQPLESRRLLSSSLSLGILSVFGTAGDDRIRVIRDQNQIFVTINRAAAAVYNADDTQAVFVYGNRGNDKITVSVSKGVAVGPLPGIPPHTRIEGGGGNDTLVCGGGDDTLVGGGGNNYLDAGDGNNRLLGEAGNDTLIPSGVSADDFAGGTGNDTIDYSAWPLTAVTVSLDDVNNDGRDLSFFTTDDGNGPVHIPPEEHDNVHSDVENVVGGPRNDSITGDGADNRLIGGGGNDTLVGGAGDDTLLGGSGKDLLDGGDGADQIFGGRGSDTVDYSSRTQPVWVNLADGLANDGTTEGNGPGSENDDLRPDVENVIGTPGNDILFGNDSSNTFVGLGGNDEMTGEHGADLLVGGDGNDSFLPGSFDTGDDAANIIRGGPGTDTVSSAAAGDVVDADVEKAFYRGHLQSITPVGSTGWIITPPSSSAFEIAIDVDVTTNNLASVAQASDASWVWINGHFEVRDIPKRGSTRVVVAESIQAVSE